MKFGLFALMLVASWLMYDNRALVVDAYTTSESDVDIRLTGIDLDIETTPLPPSPFFIKGADDTRRRPLELAYVTPSGDDSDAAVDMRSGSSTIAGTAVLNSGPASGATVLIERHTSAGVGSRTVQADDEGRWAAGDLPGGRYRIRAWLAGRAVDRAGTVFFLEDGEGKSHGFRLEEIEEKPSVRLSNSGAMFNGLTGSAGATVSQRQVDDQGRVVTGPVPGARVTLQVSGAATLESPGTVTVDGSGHATFRLRCSRIGSVSLSASVELPRSAPQVVDTGDDTAATTNDGAQNKNVIRTSGRHPGCKAIPPPPTTALPTTGDGSKTGSGATGGNTGGGAGNAPTTSRSGTNGGGTGNTPTTSATTQETSPSAGETGESANG